MSYIMLFIVQPRTEVIISVSVGFQCPLKPMYYRLGPFLVGSVFFSFPFVTIVIPVYYIYASLQLLSRLWYSH